MSSYLTGCYVFSRKLSIPFCNPNTILKQRLQQTHNKQTKKQEHREMGKEGRVRYFLRDTEIMFSLLLKGSNVWLPPPLPFPPLSWAGWLSVWFKITKKLNDHKCPSFTSTLSWTHKVKALSLECYCENSAQKGSLTNLYTSINMNTFCIFPKQTAFSKESTWQALVKGSSQNKEEWRCSVWKANIWQLPVSLKKRFSAVTLTPVQETSQLCGTCFEST